MTIQERTPLTAAEIQDIEFNKASRNVKRATYNPLPGTAWAIIGCVFGGAVTKEQADTVLPPLLDALPGVTETKDERFWMPTPATNEVENSQFDLFCSYQITGTQVFVGTPNQPYFEGGHATFLNVVVSTLVGIYVLQVPSELDGPTRLALQTAIQAIGGVSICKVLLSEFVGANITGAELKLEVRYRNDPTPKPE